VQRRVALDWFSRWFQGLT